MNVYEQQSNILKYITSEMEKAEDMDTVNKLYRQARAWNRFNQISLGEKPSRDCVAYSSFNDSLKIVKNEFRRKLAGAV